MDCVAIEPNVARAIRRSRAARDAIRRRKRRAALAACAVAALGGGIGLSLAGVSPNDAVQAAVTQAKSLTELFDQRSPGERTEGALTKTKRVHRALAKHRKRIAPPEPFELAKILMPPPEQVPVDLEPVVPLLAANSPPLEIFLNSPGGGLPGVIVPGGPGGGGGSPGPGGPQTNPSSPPEPLNPPAVPEPGTWATMLLGFGLVGWRLRRRTQRATAALVA
jgi:hypothetical protein